MGKTPIVVASEAKQSLFIITTYRLLRPPAASSQRHFRTDSGLSTPHEFNLKLETEMVLTKEILREFSDEGSTIDIDRLTDRMLNLTGQVDSYKDDIIRFIHARCDILGIPRLIELDSKLIEELLCIKNDLDRTFRERFRLTPEISSDVGIDPLKTKDFTCGRQLN